MAKVTTYQVGYCTHPSCMVLKGSGFASRHFPVHAYLIQTSVGNYLWDTGYAEYFRKATSGGVYRLYGRVTPIVFDERESLRAQLLSDGISPDDIRALILSHFHADHIAGIQDFPKARLLASASGWQAVRHLRGISALRQAFLPQLMPLDIEHCMDFVEAISERDLPPELMPFTRGWDLTGTGEIFVIRLPGHAKGHLGAFVLVDHGWILLASDAAWVRENYQEMRGPSEVSFLIQDSRADYYRTLKLLNELYKRGTVDIKISHQS
jgi:glyoxylase-like metal-dependent hydrolase (beta-lactamase superfamily II)